MSSFDYKQTPEYKRIKKFQDEKALKQLKEQIKQLTRRVELLEGRHD